MDPTMLMGGIILALAALSGTKKKAGAGSSPTSDGKRTPLQAAQFLREFLLLSGRFGSASDRPPEVIAAQADMQLTPDGIVGPKTRAAAKLLGVTLPDKAPATQQEQLANPTTGRGTRAPAVPTPATKPTRGDKGKSPDAPDLEELARFADTIEIPDLDGVQRGKGLIVPSADEMRRAMATDPRFNWGTRSEGYDSATGKMMPGYVEAKAARDALKIKARDDSGDSLTFGPGMKDSLAELGEQYDREHPAEDEAPDPGGGELSTAEPFDNGTTKIEPLTPEQGDKEEIKAVQRQLGVTPDGVIGPQTRAAAAAKGVQLPPTPAEKKKEEIKAVQRQLGVTPDGVIGPQTRAAAAKKGVKLPAAAPAKPAAKATKKAPAPPAAPSKPVTSKQPAPKAPTQALSKTQAPPRTETSVSPATKAPPRPAPKVAPRPAPKVAPRPVAKVAPKPAPRPAARPAAAAKPKQIPVKATSRPAPAKKLAATNKR